MCNIYYNEEIKKNYLEYCAQHSETERYITTEDRVFRQTFEYEKELEKDCCNFTISEIIIFMQRRFSTSLESLNVIVSILRSYTNWCVERNMVDDSQNHYNEVTHELMISCLNTCIVEDKIISRKDLLHQIRDSIIMNPSDKALMLALFEGICGTNMDDLVTLNCDNICEVKDKTDSSKKKKYIVSLNSGKEFEISEELVKYCRESQDEYYYTMANGYVAPLLKTDRGVFKNIDRTDANSISRKTLYNKMVRIKDKLGLTYLTTNSLRESGRIEMVRDMVNKGVSINDALGDPEVVNRYGKVPSFVKWKLKYEDYLIAKE